MMDRRQHANTRFLCPYGHPVENRLGTNVNTGLSCPTCNQVYRCQAECGWRGRVYHHTMTPEEAGGTTRIQWIGREEGAALGLWRATRDDWKDGGVYGLCPRCKAGIVVIASYGSWGSSDHLVAAGGRIVTEPEWQMACAAHGDPHERAARIEAQAEAARYHRSIGLVW